MSHLGYSLAMKYGPMLQGIKGIDNRLIWAYLKEVSNLGRADRINWALKRLKFTHLYSLKDNGEAMTDSHAKFLLKHSDILFVDRFFDLARLKEIVALLDTSKPLMDSIIFDKQSSETILNDLTELDFRYQNKVLNPKSTPFLISDGFGWFDLKTSYCETEGAIGRHCGNVEGTETETIWTLRFIDLKDSKFGTHCATFIYDFGRNALGEMKGTGNERPLTFCHQAIVDLLISKPDLKIVGGGYKPENNFSVDQLSPALLKQLISHRPDLAP